MFVIRLPNGNLQVPQTAIRQDGRVIGDGRPGPVTIKLSGLLAELAATTGTPITPH